MIYFIRDGKYVKIGYTQDQYRLDGRVRALQVGNPRNLTVMAVMQHGGPRTERALHDLFEPYRVSGEWFELGPALRATITVAANGGLPADVVAVATAAMKRATRSTRRGDRVRGRTKADHAPELPAIFPALRAWRKEAAAVSNAPAYTIASDAALANIAQAQPTTLTALQACRGIGPAFIRRHGQSCLTAIREAQ